MDEEQQEAYDIVVNHLEEGLVEAHQSGEEDAESDFYQAIEALDRIVDRIEEREEQ